MKKVKKAGGDWWVPLGWIKQPVCSQGCPCGARRSRSRRGHPQLPALRSSSRGTRLHTPHIQKLHSCGKLVPHRTQHTNGTAEWADPLSLGLIYFGNSNSRPRRTDTSRRAAHSARKASSCPTQLFLKTIHNDFTATAAIEKWLI